MVGTIDTHVKQAAMHNIKSLIVVKPKLLFFHANSWKPTTMHIVYVVISPAKCILIKLWSVVFNQQLHINFLFINEKTYC